MIANSCLATQKIVVPDSALYPNPRKPLKSFQLMLLEIVGAIACADMFAKIHPIVIHCCSERLLHCPKPALTNFNLIPSWAAVFPHL